MSKNTLYFTLVAALSAGACSSPSYNISENAATCVADEKVPTTFRIVDTDTNATLYSLDNGKFLDVFNKQGQLTNRQIVGYAKVDTASGNAGYMVVDRDQRTCTLTVEGTPYSGGALDRAYNTYRLK